MRAAPLALLFLLPPSPAPLAAQEVRPGEPAIGRWHGELHGPGGEIPFDFRLVAARDADGAGATLEGGLDEPTTHHPHALSQTIAAYDSIGVEPFRITLEGDRLTLSIEHYDSHLVGTLSEDGTTLEGTWRKRRSLDGWSELPFRARHGARPAWPEVQKRGGPPGPFTGRYSVDFRSSEVPAVMDLHEDYLGRVRGTILTHVGDYRFLHGRHEDGNLTLSTFDGAHAFLFRATPGEVTRQESGVRGFATMTGDFWSRDTWHETWTATRDPDVRLPDPYQQTIWKDDVALADLVFPDTSGTPRSLADPEFAGQAILLQVFGTWCPNCNDETRFLVELHERFADRGLSIIGLAFEVTGDFERDAAQVELYAERHEVSYPMLLAGTANKAAATEALQALDQVRSFPTTIFLTGDGRVHAIHSGFTGPATGPAHESLRAEYEARIEELLQEEDDQTSLATWGWLFSSDLFDHQAFAGGDLRFFDEDGERKVLVRQFGSGRPILGTEVLPVRVRGDAVWIGDELWRFDRDIGALFSPRRAGARLAPHFSSLRVFRDAGYAVDGSEIAEDELVRATRDAAPLVRHEAIWELATKRSPRAGSRLQEVLPLLDDPDRRVRLLAVWGVGHVGEVDAADRLLEGLMSRDAAMRRECVRALGRLARFDALADRAAELKAAIAKRSDDPDPLVREAVQAASPD